MIALQSHRAKPFLNLMMAVTLATGETTSDTAKQFRVTPSRISQVRRRLLESWDEFVGEGDDVAAG